MKRFLTSLSTVAVVAAAGAVWIAPSAAAAGPADEVTVVAGAYRASGPLTSGGIAVLDSIDDFGTASIRGRGTLAGGARVDADVAKGLFGLVGRIRVDDPAAKVRIDARPANGVTRVSDDTVRWSGLAVVTRNGRTWIEQVTVTVVDHVLDPGDHAVNLVHAGQTRNAIVHVPPGTATGARPALYHFPGLFESPANAEQFSKLRAASDRLGYLLVIPAHYGFGWQGVQAGTPSPDVDDPGYVRALTAAVIQRFGADRSRIYASGMSNGGFFTSLMACRLADVFAAFAPVAGQLNEPSECAPGRPVPIAMFHGDADPIVPYATVLPATEFWLRNNGCGTTSADVTLPDADPADGTRVIRSSYDCPAAAPVLLYRIQGGGHAWPGGEPFPVPIGVPTRDIDGNQAIWDFVSRFTLAG